MPTNTTLATGISHQEEIASLSNRLKLAEDKLTMMRAENSKLRDACRLWRGAYADLAEQVYNIGKAATNGES